MRKIYGLLAICLLMMNTAKAQTSNAILFTENGEKFTAILNGVRQNEKPETNVKITGLNAEYYKLKVIFDNPELGERNLNLYINTGTETSYCIKKNNKGEYVVRLISEVPVAQAPASPATQTVVVYNAYPSQQETVTTHTTTTTTQSSPEEVNIHMGVNVGGEGGSININASGMETEQQHSTTVTHTTTSYATTTTSHPQPVQPVSYLPGYTGSIGCEMPMAPDEFTDLKNSISSKTFEDSRMTIAKQVLNDRCMLSSQVKEVMLLFTFEENRLNFAKYAYDRTYDIGNYYKVNDAFTFESSIDDLNGYIESKH